eukprot:CAMPEP_0116901478 /NCGR_PEP_ID=MMETSP0467-20121206/9379_1 /TAXON_ID=283647 /ORGANISM="Mesodinium pulex, Strain SPMC105" /LENGTH=73 /DNA_ID=CAMNT_0004575003 /DNA_START=1492 /DNA_END=1713 /DNA_ORIENTATION=+
MDKQLDDSIFNKDELDDTMTYTKTGETTNIIDNSNLKNDDAEDVLSGPLGELIANSNAKNAKMKLSHTLKISD